MTELKVPCVIDGMETEKTEYYYNINDFDYAISEDYLIQGRHRNMWYYNIPAAFDIETTTVDKTGFMYHWQFCLGDRVCFGRRWEDYITFINRLVSENDLNINKILPVYVHQLEFEFTFMYRFFDWQTCFYRNPHKPLYARTKQGVEYRCSYFLSNMSLEKFCESSRHCIHRKLSGDDYDYRKIRTCDTFMTPYELSYCYNDVRGLCECIRSLMDDGDTLVSMPLTSTGFVRREVNAALKSNICNVYQFKRLRLDTDIYRLLLRCKRGGNTHANRLLAGGTYGAPDKPVYSMDIASSYPARLLMSYYPVSPFTKVAVSNLSELDHYCATKCVAMTVTLYDVHVLCDNVMPYIPLSLCTEHSADIKCDNGRILDASLISISLTEIDYDIIMRTYEVKAVEITECCVAKRGTLPTELRETVLDYFYKKTTLKDIDDYMYAKSKNKLNGIYGMMLMDLVHTIVEFTGTEWSKVMPDGDEFEAKLLKHYRQTNNILTYQWGIWCVAAARQELQIMIDTVGVYALYCDTDSIKFLGSHNLAKFDARNAEIAALAAECEVKPWVDYNDKRYMLGVWEREHDMVEFKTLGSKKYVYTDAKTGDFVCTVAGMSKKLGAAVIKNANGFRLGRTYHNIGRTTAYYHYDEPHYMTVRGATFLTAANIGIVDATYTLGVTNEYYELICDNLEDQIMLDM